MSLLLVDERGSVATAIVDLEPVFLLLPPHSALSACVDAAVSPYMGCLGLEDELLFIELCTFNPPVSCCNH